MKVDFSAPILDLDGNKITEAEKEITLGVIASRALLAPLPDEDRLQGDRKVKRFAIAMQAHTGGVCEVATEDAAEMKLCIAKAFAPLIVGRAWALIEGELAKEKSHD